MNMRQMNLNITSLASKAMTVRLTTSKPATSVRDKNAEEFTRGELGDESLRVSSVMFADKTNPVRVLLNHANAIYHYHVTHTLPYIDRGPRLLPVVKYESYRDGMRALVNELAAAKAKVMPQYHVHVQQDVDARNAAARSKAAINNTTHVDRVHANDYPTPEQFEQGFQVNFTFAPLPDKEHFLFDVSEEDRQALDRQLQEVEELARSDVYSRLQDPVKKIISKLRIPAGEPGSIFRDTAVSNIVDAVKICRDLAMGDEALIAMCDEVEKTILPVAHNPDMLRESPPIREAAAAKLKAVSDRMAFMFSDNGNG